MTDDRRPGDRDDAQTRRPPITVHDKRVGVGDDDLPDETQEPAAADPLAGAELVEAELAEAQRLAADRLDQLMRLKADFENYRKRVIREQTDLADRASLRVIERLFPVLDDIERALEAARVHEGAAFDEEAGPIVRGIELVSEHLLEVLRAEGLERLEAEGEPFDPHQHEAVSSAPGDVDEPTVLEVVRPGYRHRDRTIRPALVNVTTPRPDEEAAERGE